MIEKTLLTLLQQIYPEQDHQTLSKRIISIFWPETRAPASEANSADNSPWSQKDSILISYGDSLLDGHHKPFDLLHDFLIE